MTKLRKISESCYELPKTGGMRVPGRIYANEELLKTQKSGEAVQQVANVAHLPGIVGYSIAMPDFHWGYGFPIGGVAAFDAEEGVISPGGVGYDITCGVRGMSTPLLSDDLKGRIPALINELFNLVPAGVGKGGAVTEPSADDARALLREGAKWAIDRGYGSPDDLVYTEDGGCYPDADTSVISNRALTRGMKQIGTLGSGNHFLEIDVVEEIFLPDVAARLGISEGSLAVSIHCGSRGFGYQVCEDFLRTMGRAMERHNIDIPDRQLACAPIRSSEGKKYRAAMACAANFAWANRQVIKGNVESAFKKVLGISDRELGMRLIYDVCHNIAKFETHLVDGEERQVCVHRKGATRAFGPGTDLVPDAYRDIGQPVFIPGDMGRASYLLIGAQGAMTETFGSSCHGAGRNHSRRAMKKEWKGRDVMAEMADRYKVYVRSHGKATVAEEMPLAYKDVSEVVEVVQDAGISKKVCRFRPVGVLKG
jgi:tRNA-splicing ligase RtcB